MNLINDSSYDSFVCFGIDKMTLGIETKFLRYHKSPPQLHHIVDIVNWGNWTELNIQLEINGVSNIDFINPLSSVLKGLFCCINYGIFSEPLSFNLFNCIHGIFSGTLSPFCFINQFFNTGIFKLDEYELFFDFYGYNPFFNFDDKYFNIYKNSVYTKDYSVKRRSNGENKGTRRSLLSFYNRGLKIGYQYNLFRMEFRICDNRAKLILNPYDIFVSLPSFIDLHSDQIRNILKHYLPEGSIDFDKDYLYQKIPILSNLFPLLEKGGYN
jgi:hypothetical protein